MISIIINLVWKMNLITLLVWNISTVEAVPLSIARLNDNTNITNSHLSLSKGNTSKNIDKFICLVNGSVYKFGERIIGVAGPCEECTCHPPNVICSMMKCPSNIGCITLQFPNKCCPTYKCDCEHKGKLYNNGEKVNFYDDSACKVCFCNGGEIVCTSIICYTRKDCKGYTLPGDCCPKYDNCSSNYTDYENIKNNSFGRSLLKTILKSFTTTERNTESIWKRDTIKSQQLDTPALITDSLVDLNLLNVTTQISTVENNSTEIMTYDNVNTSTITVNKNNVVEKSTTLFFYLKNNNLNKELSKNNNVFIDNNDESDILLYYTEPNTYTDIDDNIETTTEIDNSIIITHLNGTESVVDVDDIFTFSKVKPPTSTTYISTEVDIFNPKELKKTLTPSKIELFTDIPKLDEVSNTDDSISREMTTPSLLSRKSLSNNPLKLTLKKLQKKDDENNTETIFTDLENTTDMFETNYGYQIDKMGIETFSDDFENKTQFENTTDNIISLFSQTSTETVSSSIIENNTNNMDILDYQKNDLSTEIDNDIMTNESNLDIITNNNMLNLDILQDYSVTHDIKSKETDLNESGKSKKKKSNDNNINENLTNRLETVPFIIKAKAVTDQTKFRYIDQSMPYPEEYPEEYETIQNGPSLTITKKTYTNIPDVIYTTTTMITLPTLDIIYKANKEVQNYFSSGNLTSISKPNNNNLKPLRNISSAKPSNSTQ
ncbi:uncharacterized protein MAL13P1.304-like isoform X3 [Daktulosphaira vitifoliae]|nr:uncharacterized protein MAL13P1.304-like isoform X3 [Daktulosphaira vitifoliae]